MNTINININKLNEFGKNCKLTKEEEYIIDTHPNNDKELLYCYWKRKYNN